MAYICFSKGKEQFNYYNEPCGISEDRLLYYHTEVGEHRVYRRDKTEDEGFELFEFKTKEAAEELCKEINELYNDDFKVIEI